MLNVNFIIVNFMIINFIGDIHGSTGWKSLVSEEGLNVFLGDYFDPYDRSLSIDDLMRNFDDIVEYREKKKNTILLYGNHDFHYLTGIEASTRRDSLNAAKIKEAIVGAELDGFAWAYGDDVIASHAGFTKDWYDLRIGGEVLAPSGLVEKLRDKAGHPSMDGDWSQASFMSFTLNASWWDTYGETKTQSPIWVRPNTLLNHNLYEGSPVVQVVGHTMLPDSPVLYDNIWFVDCLREQTGCLTYDTDTKVFRKKI